MLPVRQHLPLVRAIAQAVIQDSFPNEIDLIDVVWRRFVNSVDRAATTRISAGLPIIPHGPDEFGTAFVVMTVAAVLESVGNDWCPDLATIRTAVRETAKSLGMAEPRLREIVEAVAPKLHRAMSLLAGPQPTVIESRGEQPSAPRPAMAWVEWWLDDDLASKAPQALAYEKVAHEARTLRAQLIIDEHKAKFIGPAGPKSFGEWDQRGLIGVWLALDHSGGFFDETHIAESRVHPKKITEDRALSKYAGDARAILRTLLGQAIIPRGRHGRYYVSGGHWSWCWIRKDPDRTKSILLGSHRAVRKNA